MVPSKLRQLFYDGEFYEPWNINFEKHATRDIILIHDIPSHPLRPSQEPRREIKNGLSFICDCDIFHANGMRTRYPAGEKKRKEKLQFQ